MSTSEGKALFDAAWDACALGPVLEIGSYCGLSAHYLGAACRDRGRGAVLRRSSSRVGGEPAWLGVSRRRVVG
eukprot:gene17580-17783_t